MNLPGPLVGFVLELLAWTGVFAGAIVLRFGLWLFTNSEWWTAALIFGTSLTYLRRYRNFR